jgi:tRNA-splicing endonuclease subunit Sen15
MERLGALTRRSKAFLTFFLGISTMNPYVSITRYEVANLHLHMKPINDVHEIHLHFLYHRHDRTTPHVKLWPPEIALQRFEKQFSTREPTSSHIVSFIRKGYIQQRAKDKMTTTANNPNDPQPSALQTLLTTSSSQSSHPQHLTNLAVQIAHNLEHQHLWTSLRIHETSPIDSTPLPRPMVSGLPPQRLYIHPDEQIALLQSQKAQGKTGLGEVKAEREWVLPSHLREKWTLRRFADVFEKVSIMPPSNEDEDEDEEEQRENKWRDKKRVVLATVDDDSTIVYYIVHDGIVKPRQN